MEATILPRVQRVKLATRQGPPGMNQVVGIRAGTTRLTLEGGAG